MQKLNHSLLFVLQSKTNITIDEIRYDTNEKWCQREINQAALTFMIGLTKINSEFEATTMNFQLIETSDQKQP